MQVKTTADQLLDYLRDTSNISGGYAERLLMPASVAEVQQVLRDASAASIPVTVSGARTGTVGGAIPFGGWVVSLEKLRKIKNVDTRSMVMTAEAGVLLSDVKKAADSVRLLYPPDPTELSCQIGGTIATNASGARSFKYGSTRDWVNRLSVVLADGELIDIRRGDIVSNQGVIEIRGHAISVPTYERPNVTKNASGYFASDPLDAIDLFIGSEGTLGVVVEAELKLVTRPEGSFSGVVFFGGRDDLLAFVDAARGTSRKITTPSAHPKQGGAHEVSASLLEYFDSNSLRFIAERFPESPTDVAGAVYFEQESTVENEDEIVAAWSALIERHKGDVERSWFTTNKQDREKMRAFRHALPLAANERYSRSGFRKVSTDMAVPADRFASLLKFYEDLCGPSRIDHIIFGHIGDCHLHLNLFPRTEDEAARARHIYGRCVAQAIMSGGTVSAEHGIGKLKRKYLAAMMGERYLNEMAEIKRAFDRKGILGRGNILDESYL